MGVFEETDEFQRDPFPDQCRCRSRCSEFWYSRELSLGPFPSEDFLRSPIFDKIVAKKTNMSTNMLNEYLKCVISHDIVSELELCIEL